MSVIKVENLTFSYSSSADLIFENVNFQIDTDWKLGFVGRNGRGKTTFLNLLQGKFPYKGNISSSVQFDYFPYAVPVQNELTGEILRSVSPVAEEWEFMREFSYLEVSPEVLYRPFCTLSAYASESGIDKSLFMAILSKMGFDSRQFEKDISEFSEGQKKKTALAKSLCENAHLYVWDEPFNYIDVYSRMQIENLLKEYAPTMIFVEHDRAFRENIATSVVSLVKP